MKFRNQRKILEPIRFSPFAICAMFFVTLMFGCDSGQTNTASRNQDKAQKTNKSRSDLTPGEENPKRTSSEAIEDAVKFLLAQQDDQGLWKSEYYGNLKQGAATTAFVLYALSHAQSELRDWPEKEFAKGMKVLEPNILYHGFVTNDEGPDYSNYGSAMYLTAAHKSKFALDDQVKKTLLDYLQNSQLTIDNGFEKSNPDWGGWDLSGWMTGHRITTGSNISVSSSVIEALSIYSAKSDLVSDDCLDRAAQWVVKCQNNDGGFFFHPKVKHDGNKAGWDDPEKREQALSYGTASTDGARAISYLQAEEPFVDGERLKRAGQWILESIEKHSDEFERVPGFDSETKSQRENGWSQGLLFYYYFSTAKSLGSVLENSATNQAFATLLRNKILESQLPNGSWQNKNSRMREDDPLIATCFSLIALCELERFIDLAEKN